VKAKPEKDTRVVTGYRPLTTDSASWKAM